MQLVLITCVFNIIYVTHRMESVHCFLLLGMVMLMYCSHYCNTELL